MYQSAFEEGEQAMGITVKSLSKRFDSRVVFDNFSFNFPDKGIVLLSGRSGSGKTTLLRIISGIDNNYDGEVIGVGTVSYAFQEHRLLPWTTVLGNITVAAFQDVTATQLQEAKELLLRLGFSENDFSLYPSQLSGGMRQRVSLARAFAHASDVLILDEPTKELDRELCNTVYELIEEQSRSRTVILVTHEDVPDWLPISAEIAI